MEVAVDIELNYCFKVMKYANQLVNNSYILNYTYRISVFGDTKFTIYKFLHFTSLSTNCTVFSPGLPDAGNLTWIGSERSLSRTLELYRKMNAHSCDWKPN